jgi:hypothetical protein
VPAAFGDEPNCQCVDGGEIGHPFADALEAPASVDPRATRTGDDDIGHVVEKEIGAQVAEPRRRIDAQRRDRRGRREARGLLMVVSAPTGTRAMAIARTTVIARTMVIARAMVGATAIPVEQQGPRDEG